MSSFVKTFAFLALQLVLFASTKSSIQEDSHSFRILGNNMGARSSPAATNLQTMQDDASYDCSIGTGCSKVLIIVGGVFGAAFLIYGLFYWYFRKRTGILITIKKQKFEEVANKSQVITNASNGTPGKPKPPKKNQIAGTDDSADKSDGDRSPTPQILNSPSRNENAPLIVEGGKKK